MMLALIGGFFLLLFIDKETHCRLSSREMILIMSSWVIFLFIISEFISENVPLEIIFLSIVLGIIAIRELTNEVMSREVKKRLDIFLFLMFLIFMAIIINVLNI